MKDSTYIKHCLVIDEWFVNGFNGVKAYQKFYTDSSPENATVRFFDMVRNSKIAKYMETKTNKTADRLQITLESQLKRLDEVINDKEERATDKINAIKEQNKLLALYEDHNRQKKSDLISDRVNIVFKNKR